MKIIILIFLVLIIILSIIYNLFYKYSDLNNNIEKFDDFNYEDDFNIINDDYLIKYSSFNYTLKSLNDVIKLNMFLIKNKINYDVIDTYIIDNNDIIDKINDKLNIRSLNSKNNKLTNNIYCIIYKNYEINDNNENLLLNGNNMTYIKIILIYSDNIQFLFQKNNFNNKTLIYEINKKYKAFNHYF